LKGLGTSSARVDFVPTGQKIENGEMFFTSGEDRIFPRGLPVGKVTSVQEGTSFQDITVEPSGTEQAPEEVLVIVDPVHQAIPEEAPGDSAVFLAPDLTTDDHARQTGGTGLTPADKLRDQYKKIGDAQKHVFGVGGPGTPPPNFNLKVPGVNAPAEAAPQNASAPASPDKKTAPAAPVAPDKKAAPPVAKPTALQSPIPISPAPQTPVPQATTSQPKEPQP
jgi:rod shape-determining protein MreC